jgi:hypothetical protein
MIANRAYSSAVILSASDKDARRTSAPAFSTDSCVKFPGVAP